MKTKLRSWPTPRDNKPWTAHDLLRMRGFAKERMSTRQAAAKLGRSTGAVKFKAMVEGIRFHAIEQPRGTQRKPAQRRLLSRITTRRHRARRRAA
jgi:hypothetical protein